MKILLAEDDSELADALAKLLHREAFMVDVARNGEDAFHLGETGDYDCVVLDLGMPMMDGLTILRRWRGAGLSFPILILTARDGWADKEAGFESGADDYLTKPFLAKEVIVRLRALIRRASGQREAVIRCGTLSYHMNNGAFYLGEDLLRLTAFETRILEKLIRNKEVVVERDRLSDCIYGYGDEIDSNSIDVMISRLRRKIGRPMIETFRGLGYRLTSKGA